MNRIQTIILAAALPIVLSACGGSEQENREAEIEAMAKKHGIDAEVTVDEDGNVENAVIKGAGGARVGKNLQLPDGFPEDVTVPEDWKIIGTTPAMGGFMISAMTESSVDDALAASREKLTADGWTETNFAQPNAMMTQIGFSKDDRMTNLNVMDSGSSRNIQMVTMQKPN